MMTVPDEGTFAVRAEPAAAAKATAATGPRQRGPRWLLPAGALLLAGVLAVYLADLVSHLSYMAAMRDLAVYRDGGLIVRHVPPAYDAHRSSPLYDWTGQNGVQFTYPPFAAVVFAVASVLSWTAMRWAMTLASLAALGLSLWLVFGALGYRDRPAIRLGATLGTSALALATEPVQQTLGLGQVNLLLMLLIVADLLTGGALVPEGRTRWWHGIGIGIAAGVKLTPLIFIPYLLLIRKYHGHGDLRGHGRARLRHPAAGFRYLLGRRPVPEGQPDRVPGHPRQPVAARRADPAGRQRFVRNRALGRGGSPGRDRRAGHGGPAVPGQATGARDAGLRADRPAGLAAELGSPLGMGGARNRAAGSPGR
jgi:hypothetical protein